MAGLTDRILVVIDGASEGLVRSLGQVQASAAKTDKSMSTMGSTLRKTLVAGAAAFVGTQLVSFLKDSAQAYGEAAKAAGELAKASGGTVDEVSRMTAALEDNGVSAEKSATLLTKFTTNAGKNATDLRNLGVQLKANAQGGVDYADAMVQAIDKINKIGNAAERNRLLVQFFGKQGAAAFNELAASGVSLSESMRLVSKYRIIDPADLANAKAYDDALDQFSAAIQGLQFTIGRALLPIMSGLADVLGGVVDGISFVVDAFTSLPGPVQAAAVAFTALNVAMRSALGGAVLSAIATGLTALTASISIMGGVLPLVTGAMKAFTASLLLNPITAIAVAIAAVVTIAASAAEHKKQEMEKNVARVKELEAEGKTRADAIDQVARATADNLKGRKAMTEGFNNNENIQRQTQALEEATAATDANTTAAQQNAEAQGTLKELIEQYVESGGTQVELLGQIDEAARSAADAKALDAQSTALAKEAMEKYDTSIQGVIERLKGLDPFGAKIEELASKLQNALDADPSTRALDVIQDKVGTWADETKQSADEARTAILDAMAVEEERPGDFNPLAFLDNLLIEVPQAKGSIDALKAELAANPVATPWKLQPEPGTVDAAKADLDILKQPVTTSVTFNTAFNPGGYNDVKARKDYLAQEASTVLGIDTQFNPDGYNALKARKDYLANNVAGQVTINTVFAPDGYNALKARKDYLAQDRTATITFRTQGLAAATQQVRNLNAGAQQQIILPPAAPAPTPINLVRVSIDGQQLRAVVRDELRAAQPMPVGVA